MVKSTSHKELAGWELEPVTEFPFFASPLLPCKSFPCSWGLTAPDLFQFGTALLELIKAQINS